MIPVGQLKSFENHPWLSAEDIEDFRNSRTKCFHCKEEAVIEDEGTILDKDGEIIEEDAELYFCWDCYKEFYIKSDLSKKEIEDHLSEIEKQLRKESAAFTRYLRRIKSIRPANQQGLAAFIQKEVSS